MVFAACDSTPKFHVEGTIEEAADSMLYLEAATLNGIKAIDSVKLGASGSFTFKGDAPTGAPDFYILRCGNHRINFSVDSTETITFSTKLPRMSEEYTVEGSENSAKIKEISLMQIDLQRRIIALEKNESMYPGDITDSIKSLLASYKERIKNDYIYKAPASAYAYYAVCQSITDLYGPFLLFDPLNDRSDVKTYATVATAWDGTYPESPRTEQICNAAIKGMEQTAAPREHVIELDESKVTETGIINVSLPDANSKIRSITDLKGKVVLMDFTLYGAKESAQRTRLMRTLYDKYKDQGFEIYQISLDDDIHFWKSSVVHLPWVCVHETDGQATNSYGINTLPTFFLINRDNEVVLRSEMMQGDLETEIRKLL